MTCGRWNFSLTCYGRVSTACGGGILETATGHRSHFPVEDVRPGFKMNSRVSLQHIVKQQKYAWYDMGKRYRCYSRIICF